MKPRFIILLVFSMSFLLSACQSSEGDASAEQAPTNSAPPPVAVSSIVVKAEDIPVQYEYVGQVAGSLEVDIRSRVTGIIEQKHFTEGGEVEANQLLFSLDAAPFEAKYKQAQAAIDSAQAQKITAQAELKKARRELKRVTPLANQKMLSQNQQDDAASAVDIAVAQLAVADAAIKQAEANLLSAKIDLDYTRIRAPVKGIIGRSLQNRGALVQTGNNDLLTTLVQIDPVYINFGIPENDYKRLRQAINKGTMSLPNGRYIIDLVDEEGKVIVEDGVLDFQDYKVDNNTGNFAMRATLPNVGQQLSPGQFARVILKGTVRNAAIAIPQRAVLDGPGGKYVYLVTLTEQGQVAMQRDITLGEWVDLGGERNNYWIVKDGLTAGDEVIIDGVARIFFPGMPVQVTEPDASGKGIAQAQ